MLILCTLRVVVSFTLPFSVSPAMFGTLRFLEGMSSLAVYQLSFVIGKKITLDKKYFMVFVFLMTFLAFSYLSKISYRTMQYNLLCQLIFIISSKLYLVFHLTMKMKPVF